MRVLQRAWYYLLLNSKLISIIMWNTKACTSFLFVYLVGLTLKYIPGPPFKIRLLVWLLSLTIISGIYPLHAQNISTSNGVRTFTFSKNTTTKDYIPGVIIIKFKSPSSQISTKSSAISVENTLKRLDIKFESIIKKFNTSTVSPSSSDAKQNDEFGLERIYEIKYSDDRPIEKVINELLKNDQVEYAEPSFIDHLNYDPNDPSFGLQNYLKQVKAPEAWNIIRNSSTVVIGIVDSGSDLDHPDLAANIYVNTSDPINGKDDDNDGYIDNYWGWDMTGASYVFGYKGDNDPNVKSQDNDHGVHVSGIASAVSDNNIGVSSIASNAKLLIVKCAADNENNSRFYNAYEGIKYAVDHGAKIINCSWGSDNYSNSNLDIINYALSKDCLIIAAAGNDDSSEKHYPSSYPGVISVASVDVNDRKSGFSNYGPDVSISAPGSAIYNTIFNNAYGYKQGTSMAAPVVASAAALLKAYYPSYTMKQIGQLMVATADNIDNKNPGYLGELGSGRLNVYRALTENRSQNIVFPALTSKTFGSVDFEAGAIATSGLLVSYASSNTAVVTIISGKIHIVGAGTTTITASQPGNSNFAPAVNVDRPLTINKALQPITFPVFANKVYKDPDFDPGATTPLGLLINYTSSNTNVATIVNSKVHIIAVGNTTIIASHQGNNNHSSSSVSRILTVGKASQAITFPDLPVKSYSDPDFSAAATASSGLPVSYSSSDITIATISNGKIHIVKGGVVTITASQVGDSNYNPAPNVSQVLTIRAPQTITFNALPSKIFGDPDFDPGAAANSTLPVSYSSSNTEIATIVNGKIHINGAGLVTITATQGGNTNYTPAADAVQTLTVGKASQTITFTALPQKTYGDANFDPVASSSSGLPITFTSSNASLATITNGKIVILGAGTVTITATQAGNSNYLAASVNQVLTIGKASQTITFLPLSLKSFADPDFDPGATASSGLAVSYSSSNPAIAAIANGKVDLFAGGTVTITASQVGNSNYNPAPNVSQVLTIRAPQTIAFNVLPSKIFGDSDFDPGATASSSLPVSYSSSNTEIATIVNGKIHINGVGSVTITASQSGNSIYAPARDAIQTLTINKASQTITFAPLSQKIYGDTGFDITASSSSGLVVTFTSSNTSVATITNGKIVILAAGITTITATQSGNTNFLTASVSQVLTVNKASQIITFSPFSLKSFTDPDFDPGATASSGLTVSYSSSNPAIAAIANGKVDLIAGGTVTITASQVGNSNYNPAPNVSQVLTIRAPQTITFNTLPSKVFGDPDFDPGASASSTLSVSYSSSNLSVAIIVSGKVRIVGAGVTNITASQSGNGSYVAAADVTQSLTINKASQSITFQAFPSKTFKDPDFDIPAASSSSLQISFTSGNLNIATIVNGKIHIEGAGTVIITASQNGNTNYNPAANVSRELIVNKAAQTITFSPVPVQLRNGLSYTLQANSNSNLALNFASSDISTAPINGASFSPLKVGKVLITASQAGNNNYLPATPVSQAVQITDTDGAVVKILMAVSPNADGINDYLQIEGIKDYPKNKVLIFSRNGSEILKIDNYDNQDKVFKGKTKSDQIVPQGTYFYLVHFDRDGLQERKMGYFVVKY